jgi:hypothetical protein
LETHHGHDALKKTDKLTKFVGLLCVPH